MPFYRSSLFDRAEYDPFQNRMLLWFSGAVDPYVYEGVPAEIWLGLQAARSKGAYFARYIRGAYEGRKAV